jgi:sorbose reductase
VQSWEAVRDAVDKIVEEFNGRLDIFVANSGIAWDDGPFIDGSLDKMAKLLAVNVDGTFYCARAAALQWRRQKQEGTTIDGQKLHNFSYGSFIATASMSGHITNIPRMQATYNASKAAVIHACRFRQVSSVTHESADQLHRQVICR